MAHLLKCKNGVTQGSLPLLVVVWLLDKVGQAVCFSRFPVIRRAYVRISKAGNVCEVGHVAPHCIMIVDEEDYIFFFVGGVCLPVWPE